MRPLFKYIFCGLVLAALIFISLCVFYIANTYAVNIKNKNKPIFDYHTASYFANVGAAEIHEIENIKPLETPTDGKTTSGSLDGSVPHSEPSRENPVLESEPEPDIEPDVEPDIEPDVEPDTEPDTEPDMEPDMEPEPDISNDMNIDYSDDLQTELQEDSALYEFEPSENDLESANGSNTESEILYEILVTMKINQFIMIFICAVAFIILVFRPIGKSILDEPFGF